MQELTGDFSYSEDSPKLLELLDPANPEELLGLLLLVYPEETPHTHCTEHLGCWTGPPNLKTYFKGNTLMARHGIQGFLKQEHPLMEIKRKQQLCHKEANWTQC
ncbi:unnamed protein product [Natator depressus]